MTIMENHHLAMELTDTADAYKRSGDIVKAKEYYLKAFELEKNAAMKLEKLYSVEPTRSILYRSAASLAVECDEYREAEKMVYYALFGLPPDNIAEELRDLLETVNSMRHLQVKGLELDRHELQFSIAGPAVGYGFARSRDVRERLDKIETLSIRTAERKLGIPFREMGRPAKDISDMFQLFEVATAPGSYAMTLRITKPQLVLPELDSSPDIMNEMMECIELFSDDKSEQLNNRINNLQYYNNFISIVDKIIPDGRDVTVVGFTYLKDNHEKKIRLGKNSGNKLISESSNNDITSEIIEMCGTLRHADSTRKNTD